MGDTAITRLLQRHGAGAWLDDDHDALITSTVSEAQLGEVLAVALQDIPALPELSDHNTPSTGPGA